MARFRVLPYKSYSNSAKRISEALGGKMLKLVGSSFTPKPEDVIINWGNSSGLPKTEASPPYELDYFYLNPAYVSDAIQDKLKFFELMKENLCEKYIPRFWKTKEEIPDDFSGPIVCRALLRGHSGAGISIASSVSDIHSVVPLYTEYMKKKDEYRIHLGKRNGDTFIISVQRKARRNGFDNPNWQVRNHKNGFVYVRDNVSPPNCVMEAAKACFLASGLDFGAVDVIYNAHQDRAYVLEINTAPGLEGTTVEDYKKFFEGFASGDVCLS